MLRCLGLKFPVRNSLHLSFGFGQSFGQVSVSVSVSAETQNCGFGRSLLFSLFFYSKINTFSIFFWISGLRYLLGTQVFPLAIFIQTFSQTTSHIQTTYSFFGDCNSSCGVYVFSTGVYFSNVPLHNSLW